MEVVVCKLGDNQYKIALYVVNTSTKRLHIDFEVVIFRFLILRYTIAL